MQHIVDAMLTPRVTHVRRRPVASTNTGERTSWSTRSLIGCTASPHGPQCPPAQTMSTQRGHAVTSVNQREDPTSGRNRCSDLASGDVGRTVGIASAAPLTEPGPRSRAT